MLHMTTNTDDRIRDLHATAADLRNERLATPDGRPGRAQALRVRIGIALLFMGAALVSGASPATTSRAGR